MTARSVRTRPGRTGARRGLTATIVCAFGAVLAASNGQPPPAAPELRGLWVLRTSLVSNAAIDTVVRDAVRGGFNTLFVQVRGRGDAFYKSSLEPRAAELARTKSDFDPLARTIAAARRAGLGVHAWVNVNLVASAVTVPRAREHVVSRHPEWLMVPSALAEPLARLTPGSPEYVTALAEWSRDAGNVEGLYLSPVLDASRRYTASVIREIVAAYDLDGLHLDYIRYPADVFDYSATALDEFRRESVPLVDATTRERLDESARTDVTAWTRMYPERWSDFRRERLTDLLSGIAEEARAARPGVLVSAAVVPNSDEARRHRFQDWPFWMRSRLLDAVCPMIYTTDATEFTAAVEAVAALSRPAPVWAGIGAYRLRLDETAERVRVARRSGAAGVVLFRYESLAAPDVPAARVLPALRAVLTETDRARAGGR